MSRIATTFNELRARGETALIPFVTAGDPCLAMTGELIHVLVEAGADLIEIGVPFSDPMADGPTIQAASERALAAGTTLPKILAMVRTAREHTNVPIILMGYYNPIFRYGGECFVKDAVAAGVDALLLVDLPPEEAAELQPHMRAAGLELITLLAPTTPPERRLKLASRAEGFIYYVSMTGVTGAQAVDAAAIATDVQEIKVSCATPVAVGFGITTPAEAAAVGAFADAVVVGSALVKIIAAGGDTAAVTKQVADFIRGLKSALLV
ncbi:MAG: tryptophan synthase subunit alpha [Desulfuromonadales bacterium]|nr:tryptophan synthase subunit alpha [Desulfuromonadales bacterium]